MRAGAAHWRNLLHHGEIVGFVAAWIVGLLIVFESHSVAPPVPKTDNIASADPTAAAQVRAVE